MIIGWKVEAWAPGGEEPPVVRVTGQSDGKGDFEESRSAMSVALTTRADIGWVLGYVHEMMAEIEKREAEAEV